MKKKYLMLVLFFMAGAAKASNLIESLAISGLKTAGMFVGGAVLGSSITRKFKPQFIRSAGLATGLGFYAFSAFSYANNLVSGLNASAFTCGTWFGIAVTQRVQARMVRQTINQEIGEQQAEQQAERQLFLRQVEAAFASPILSILDSPELQKCPICLEGGEDTVLTTSAEHGTVAIQRLNYTKYTLPSCGHLVCKPCIQRIKTFGSDLKCPLCMKSFT